MDAFHYDLKQGESIILADSSVRFGVKGSYAHELLLTNQNIVFVERGLLGSVKQTNAYPLDFISEARIAIAKNGQKQLEIVYGETALGFFFPSDERRQMRLWSMAINDQLSEFQDYFDAGFYDRFSQENLKKVARRLAERDEPEQSPALDAVNLGNLAVSVLKGGDISKSFVKGVKRTARKTTSEKLLKGLKDEFGITDIQNEFLEMFGLETEETNAEKEDRMLDLAFDYEVSQARKEIAERRQLERDASAAQQEAPLAAAKGVDEQVEAVKKLKGLLDEGILTQEEFDRKKKEVMGL